MWVYMEPFHTTFIEDIEWFYEKRTNVVQISFCILWHDWKNIQVLRQQDKLVLDRKMFSYKSISSVCFDFLVPVVIFMLNSVWQMGCQFHLLLFVPDRSDQTNKNVTRHRSGWKCGWWCGRRRWQTAPSLITTPLSCTRIPSGKPRPHTDSALHIVLQANYRSHKLTVRDLRASKSFHSYKFLQGRFLGKLVNYLKCLHFN